MFKNIQGEVNTPNHIMLIIVFSSFRKPVFSIYVKSLNYIILLGLRKIVKKELCFNRQGDVLIENENIVIDI